MNFDGTMKKWIAVLSAAVLGLAVLDIFKIPYLTQLNPDGTLPMLLGFPTIKILALITIIGAYFIYDKAIKL